VKEEGTAVTQGDTGVRVEGRVTDEGGERGERQRKEKIVSDYEVLRPRYYRGAGFWRVWQGRMQDTWPLPLEGLRAEKLLLGTPKVRPSLCPTLPLE
jgi:hypothetical protein